MRKWTRKLALGLAMLTTFAFGAFGFDLYVYGYPSLNDGIVIITKSPLPSACIGLEVWGSPGFFGNLFDAGACDI